MKKNFILAFLVLGFSPVFAQKNLLPKFVRKMLFEQDSSKHSSFFLLPVLGSAPETGLEGGGSALYSFYTDTLGNNTRVSNIFGYATLTTKGQSRLSLTSSYWTPQNKYHFTGAISFINFPFDYFGIGNNTRKADLDRLGQTRLRLRFTAEKRLGKNVYVGLVAGSIRYKFKDKEPGGIYETLTPIQRPYGGTVLFAGPSLVFDTRNNNTYTTNGAIVTTYFEVMKGVYSINDYKGGFLEFEYAQFFSLSKRLVLGLNINEQSLIGETSPFYLLPTLGTDEIMRGYYNGRFRDRNLLAGQTELRYRITNRFGIVGFVGAGEVFNSSFSFNELKPSYGLGGRFFFDVEKALSVRVDYAFGEKRPGETRQSGLYLSLAEAF